MEVAYQKERNRGFLQRGKPFNLPLAMKSTQEWVVVRIDEQIAAISTNYSALARITAKLAQQKSPTYKNITADTVNFDKVWEISKRATWKDLLLFGTDFQKSVWRKLWELTHPEAADNADLEAAGETHPETEIVTTENVSVAKNHDPKAEHATPRLISYSDFAELCNNRAGVRAVAHAIGLNPISVLIPCHLVVPKESIDRIREIQRKAESTIFKGEDLCMSSILEDSTIDFGEYSLGKELKRELIVRELE